MSGFKSRRFRGGVLLYLISHISYLIALPSAYGDAAPTYMLVGPGVAWRANNTGVTAQNAWASRNSAFAAKAFSWSRSAVKEKPTDLRLVGAEDGFPLERNKPQYYMGDTLTPPSDVDWDATYSAFNSSSVTNNFLFDRAGERVFVVRGETSTFKWVRKNGSVNEVPVIASPVSAGRPKNIFWTDAVYGGRTVDLSGKFVKMFGPSGILDVTRERRPTGSTLDDATNYVEVVTRGVYIDETDGNKTLYAAGKPSGTFVLAYYDSGSYDRLVEVITVQVSAPLTIVQSQFHVGDELKATGRGYDVSGLQASPTTTDAFDERGTFLYQHNCEHSYSSQDGCVFAIRPSTDATRNQTQIYWFEKDNQGVLWPFEVDEYLVSWADDMPVFVRGDKAGDPGLGMTIPTGYITTLMDYQESDVDGATHATAPVGGVFTTTGPGRSLLKLASGDSVWFVPVRSVLRGDAAWYNPCCLRRDVGQELVYRSNSSVNGAALGRQFEIDESIPGYIYQSASDPVWNPRLYSESGTGASGCPSVVYAVTAPMDAAVTNAVEVWWSAHYAKDGMPAALTYPTLPQNYRIGWPNDDETPDITLASQLGSAGISHWSRNGAVTFLNTLSRVCLQTYRYFPDGNGTLSFWTRPQIDDVPRTAGVTNAPTCLMQLGHSSGKSIFFRIGKDERFQLVHGNETLVDEPMPTLERVNSWMHVALTVENFQDLTLYLDGTNRVVTTRLAAPVKFISEPLDQCAIGLTLGLITNALQWVAEESEEVKAKSEEVGEGGLTFVECGTWAEVQTALTSGRNARLTKDVTVGGIAQIVLSDVGDVTLDLNGHAVSHDIEGASRVFLVMSGSRLTLTGSGTIDGNSFSGGWGGAFAEADSGAELILDGDVVVTGFHANGGNAGAVFVGTGGAFTMNGGTIKNCSANNGGAVYLAKGAAFTLNGGTIQSCSASSFGGAVDSNCGKLFTMNGGTIWNCSAKYGGGVAFYGAATGILNGGTIKNCSGALGGGVFQQGAILMMNGGRIVDNVATSLGGGVHLHQNGDQFAMYGGAICGNTCKSHPCISVQGGMATLQGGILDVEPIAANICVSSSVSFAEPPYHGPGPQGRYIIGLGTAQGRQIAEVKMWSRAFSAAEVAEGMYRNLNGDEPGLTGYYSFYDDGDGEPFKERRVNLACTSHNVACVEPGAPGEGDCIIHADTMPTVYRQANPDLVGYNPNEEHAFVQSVLGEYVVWALRCDLNQFDNVSKPGVLVEYVQDGVAKMRYFDVKVTNPYYTEMASDCKVGMVLPGPRPLLLFDDPFLPQNYWTDGAIQPYRDRKGQIWARAAGTFDIYMYYRQQAAFDWPSEVRLAAEPKAVGDAVPWLAYLREGRGATDPKPAEWTWRVSWPDEKGVPKMKIGQTLVTAADGLPEVWNAKSIAVLYPTENLDQTALLYDPTAKRTSKTGLSFQQIINGGLEISPHGKLVPYKGYYCFQDMPPSVTDRCYLDASDADKVKLVLFGRKDDDTVGEMHMNVLESGEKAAIKALVPAGCAIYDSWQKAVDGLPTEPIRCTTTSNIVNTVTGRTECKAFYEARDHYALTAMGLTNWVVIIENDAPEPMCSTGNPISMHVFRIVPEYELARVVTREDPVNLVSRVLSINYTEHFAGKSGSFEFQWAKAPPNTNGTIPVIGEGQVVKDENGLTTFTVGGQGDTLANMVNTYWTCRYRATPGSPAHAIMGDAWSDWCTPYALAEGWVQRVLNNITPFTQRVTDLYENGIDSSVSMQTQAGAPYTGDVALNQDNLSEVGLIQLYRTILSQAESMSLLMQENDPAGNKQLLLAVERLADMYGVLGDEAYTDALNPTIGFGSTLVNMDGAGLDLPYGALSSSLFCFDNQMPSLLDEELALMRGRSCVNAPDNTVGPCYNRLVWNFTKGITAGEVAYAVNYNISGVSENGTMDEEIARAQFPQGHGDAYGHYLSALQGYYRLLRNPYFSWDGIVGMGEMNVADNAVNVDYYDEATFAKFAAKVAKTAAKTVELTALKHWRDNGADTVGGGYVDANVTNAFGYGEWASRGGFGAFCNWAVANDLLPEEQTTNDLGVAYEDVGLLHIDRGTAEGIGELVSAVRDIQRMADRMDSGMNPLGLNDKAVPFDLTPIGGAGDATHYEQVRERAQTALANAATVLDKAQTAACRRRNIEDAASTFYSDRLALAEQQYKNKLVDIYGKPYADDIGPGKTYPQGYDGPDYYHFMWMDIVNFGLTDTMISTTIIFQASSYTNLPETIRTEIFGCSPTTEFADISMTLEYRLSSECVIIKPEEITGERRRSGSLQLAYADFLSAFAAVRRYMQQFERSHDRMMMEMNLVKTLNHTRTNVLMNVEQLYREKVVDENGEIVAAIGSAREALQEWRDLTISSHVFGGAADIANVVLAVLAASDIFKAIAATAAGVASGAAVALRTTLEAMADWNEAELLEAEMDVTLWELEYQTVAETAYVAERVIAAADDQVAILANISEAWTAMETAQQKVSTLLTQADNIRDELRLVRQQIAKNITKMRYYDMFFRETENEALSQYGASFAIARTYALLAAKAYGYETGSPLESTEEGREVLRQIVGARMIGELAADGSPMVTENGDAGLSGILAKLDANWANRKTQLGINNPQPYATWFSLRHELFRILTDETGDNAWKTELAKYWVEDIRTDGEFKRYCQPFASQFGLADKEPAIIIPFETTIDFAYNLFGKPLAFDDHQFDSTYYATKISSAGVWFEGYNEKRDGYKGPSAFALNPNVYLVPVGTDRMRVPGSDSNDEIADFNVLDQTIPAPYPLTAAEIAEANWLPSYLDGDLGGVDGETRIRRHPSFRAYFGNRGETPDDEQLDATRLTGRSVWNTRWLLVIPAGALGSDRDAALKAFIYGLDTDRDGIIDVKPVSDIKIGFKTYSMGGL